MKKTILATLTGLAWCLTLPAFAAQSAIPCPVLSVEEKKPEVVEMHGVVVWLVTDWHTGEFVKLVDKFPNPIALSWDVKPCLQKGRKLYTIQFDGQSPKQEELAKWEGKFVTVKAVEGKDRVITLREIVEKK